MAVTTVKSASATAIRPFTYEATDAVLEDPPQLLSEDVRATFRSLR